MFTALNTVSAFAEVLGDLNFYVIRVQNIKIVSVGSEI